ncbi:phosphoenolpyruvate--protein phosphotransferase [Acidithrix sp. C25]|uniref:phosphoenolpyruvate--protein phosphotransferase n=1 Tax=Acidithrix sp. C25 TaxID=1671482 RepID=UPI0032DEC9A8
MLKELKGIAVSSGLAQGVVATIAPPIALPPELDLPLVLDPKEIETTISRIKNAIEVVASRLDLFATEVDAEIAPIISAQVAIARDQVLFDRICEYVAAGSKAEYAVSKALGVFRDQFLLAGGYLAERAGDLDDLSGRIVAELLQRAIPGLPIRNEPYVLVAIDLSPADTAGLDPKKVMAIITEKGGPTSHTAIIAKSLGITAIINVQGAGELVDGEFVIVDGSTGTVVVDPSGELLKEHELKVRLRTSSQSSSGGPGRTADGHGVELLVNVGRRADFALAGLADSEGVGLFRTEFLYLDRTSAPELSEQVSAYLELFSAFSGRKVIVRTLDAGADKPLAFANNDDEPNPALGLRGYRITSRNPQLLELQLEALSIAAQATNAEVWVMAPMISTALEARSFSELVHSKGLRSAGSMIEVPSAAIRANLVVGECDFVSIGTNDLAQYTFAIDRETAPLPELLDPWQPALLELISHTARAANLANKPVGICGEAASDPLLAVVFVGFGVTSLSMAPISIPPVRDEISKRSLEICRKAAEIALNAVSAREARELVSLFLVAAPN